MLQIESVQKKVDLNQRPIRGIGVVSEQHATSDGVVKKLGK